MHDILVRAAREGSKTRRETKWRTRREFIDNEYPSKKLPWFLYCYDACSSDKYCDNRNIHVIRDNIHRLTKVFEHLYKYTYRACYTVILSCKICNFISTFMRLSWLYLSLWVLGRESGNTWGCHKLTPLPSWTSGLNGSWLRRLKYLCILCGIISADERHYYKIYLGIWRGWVWKRRWM